MDEPVRHVLVLAGRRAAGDGAFGPRPKALLELEGVPLLERVLACLERALGPVPLHVSTADAALLAATPALRRRREAGRLVHHAAAASPAASVLAFLTHEGTGGATLVTTADHALLTPEMVRHFVDAAAASDADVVAAVVDAARVRAAFPESRRTFVPLRGGGVTGANLFLFRTPRGAAVARFWMRAEAVRKRPWRLVALFGAEALVRFATRRLDLDAAVAHVARATGVGVAAVRMPFAECAIDVDRPEDLALARRVLAARAAGP